MSYWRDTGREYITKAVIHLPVDDLNFRSRKKAVAVTKNPPVGPPSVREQLLRPSASSQMADDWRKYVPDFTPFSEDNNVENLGRLALMVGGVLICIYQCYAELQHRIKETDASDAAEGKGRKASKKKK